MIKITLQKKYMILTFKKLITIMNEQFNIFLNYVRHISLSIVKNEFVFKKSAIYEIWLFQFRKQSKQRIYLVSFNKY